ncbi:MAG: hypothetical protein O2931_10420 [Planctomycetota bacterium]|nr:hypothetical protein [Planctomycetota bacterium]
MGQLWRRAAKTCGTALRWCAGVVCLLLGLSIMAAIPVVQFLSLGYMLEASGRVARSGRLRDGLFGLDVALSLGTLAVCTWGLLLPVRFLAEMAESSQWIHGDVESFDPWRISTWCLLTAVLSHIAWACYRGGRLRDFMWPAPFFLWHELRSGKIISRASDRFWSRVSDWRIQARFRLGLLGFLGGLFWLAPAVTLLVIAAQASDVGGVALWILGALFMAWAIRLVPLLQTQFALTGEWRALCDVQAAHAMYRRAPLAYVTALSVLLTLAIPLYLLKAELLPREAVWLPNMVFVASIFPAKLLVGWSAYLALHRDANAIIVWQVLAALIAVPALLGYILIMSATPYISWYGLASLYEQHAFLLPVPFWH